MRLTANRHDNVRRATRCRDRGRDSRHRSVPPLTRTVTLTAALLGLAVVAAGCGGSKSAGSTGGGGRSSAAVLAKFDAYSNCIRSHGIPDFPDPTTSPGGGVGIQINAGPGSDLDRNNPRFEAAKQACQSLFPGAGSQPPAQSSEKIAAELRWAHCMRSHGLPSFPDPDSQGAFDSSKFDENTPAFQSASNACLSLMNGLGAIPVHPGHG